MIYLFNKTGGQFLIEVILEPYKVLVVPLF